MSVTKFDRQRLLLRQKLEEEGIRDQRVLEPIGRLPRERFVPSDLRRSAYSNSALPIGLGQTISQPYVVARMAELLELQPADRVLDVGTGSGYAAAVMSDLCAQVYSIERHLPLAEEARERLKDLDVGNVEVRHGNGVEGWAEQAPFNGINVAAAGQHVPPALCEQLCVNGRLVMPVGNRRDGQRLVRITRLNGDKYQEEDCGGVIFVPLVDSVS